MRLAHVARSAPLTKKIPITAARLRRNLKRGRASSIKFPWKISTHTHLRHRTAQRIVTLWPCLVGKLPYSGQGSQLAGQHNEGLILKNYDEPFCVQRSSRNLCRLP